MAKRLAKAGKLERKGGTRELIIMAKRSERGRKNTGASASRKRSGEGMKNKKATNSDSFVNVLV